MSEADFNRVTAKTYEDQAKYFLNAFWDEHSADVDQIYKWWAKFAELDSQKHRAGSDLDELQSHVFLESIGETLSVMALREQLRAIDMDSNRRMALIEFLLFRYKYSVADLLARPQGTNESLDRAQEALQAVQAEISKIEKKKADLSAVANGPAGVKANAARNELEQLMNTDNTAFNAVVLSAEAAVRKAQREGGVDTQGTLWWAQRELEEAKKYKPKGGVKAIA